MALVEYSLSVYSERMATSTALLALLEREPVHGYTLKRRYDEVFPQRRPLAFGQVYASLARYERRGLAEVVAVESGSGPDRKQYRITADGVEEIDHWIGSSQDPVEFAASELLARVTVALLSGRPAQAVLDGQRQAHLIRMRALQARRREASASELLAVTYELTHLDADLRWIEDSGQRLARGELDPSPRGGPSPAGPGDGR